MRWYGLGFIEVRVLNVLRRRFSYFKLEWFHVRDLSHFLMFVDTLRDLVETFANQPSVQQIPFETTRLQ